MLSRSPLFSKLVAGDVPPSNYEINGRQYTMGDYPADAIDPPWATFLKTITRLKSHRTSHFAMMQESTRKNVERASGVLCHYLWPS
jgi:hypothetical protein